MTLSIEILLFLFFLFLAGLFSFLETSLTALRLFKLKELQVSVAKYKNLFASWETNPQRILITILIVSNFVNVVASVLISHIMQKSLGSFGMAVGAVLATVLTLIFGEIIPKSFAKTHHERLFTSFLWLINLLYHLAYPFVTVLLKIATFFFARLGRPHILEKQEDISEKEIEFLIDYSDQKGLMEAEKTEMLQNVFSLGQTLVREILIPEDSIVAVDAASSFEDVVHVICTSRFSRIPVYEGKEDNIVGIVYQKDIVDLMARGEVGVIKELIRPILFVPETQKVNQLLSEFLKTRMHMAMVINEYGNIVGLVTIEDILEEIVGDIADEHEHANSSIVPIDEGGWLVAGSTDLEDLEDLLDIKFVTDRSVTIGGFLAEKLQHLPKKGERLNYLGFCFQVQQASRRRVYQVLVFDENDEHLQIEGDVE